MALSEYRGTVDGKPELLEAMVELNEDAKDSLTEWYTRLTVFGLERNFYTCKGRNSVTVLELWWKRTRSRTRREFWKSGAKGDATGNKGKADVLLISPFGKFTKTIDLTDRVGRALMLEVLAGGIKLLHQFFEEFIDECGEIVEVRTNVARFEKYIRKHCYPKRLKRKSYVRSVAIQRLLQGREEGKKHLTRELKAFYIY